jgi:3-oxoacyl-[acyl-carrier protein] reductase
MVMRLQSRIALITGAGQGIGAACARRFAQEGASVMIVDVNEAQGSALASALSAEGYHAAFVRADVSRKSEVDTAVAAAVARFERIDILVNNAGITRDQLLMRMKREDWDAVLATNLTAAFSCTQAVLRPMIRQRSGRVINISSVVGQMGNAGQANYAASKAGLIGFTKAMAREVASRQITVNVVAPGVIDTDMTRGVSEAVRTELATHVPLGRVGSADEVAWAVCFLASDEAAYITGQVVAVNGGMYM